MTKLTHKDYKHLPKSKGSFVFGDFFKIGKLGTDYFRQKQNQLGNVFSLNFFIGHFLGILGEENNKYLLKGLKDKVTARGGYIDIFREIYPNCLLQMDGEKHKRHRAIMQKAFSISALQTYLEQMPEIISQTLHEMESDKQIVQVYPHFKLLTLRMAAKIFYGITDPILVDKMMKAISPMTQAQYSLQINIPGTVYNKALKGRKYLIKAFTDLIKKRRVDPGEDLFSKLCHATSDEGEMFADEEIIDHMIFMIQASHDTTAWSMTAMTYYLAKYPEWQDKLRMESCKLDISSQVDFRSLMGLRDLNLVFKESMRISPSIGNMFREADVDITVDGKRIPEGAKLWLSTSLPMQDEKIWKNPKKFDPERFDEPRSEHKGCPHAFMPFGAGAHLCIGNIFAEMSIKLMTVSLIRHFKASVPVDYTAQIQEIPMTMPKDGMPIILKSNTKTDI